MFSAPAVNAAGPTIFITSFIKGLAFSTVCFLNADPPFLWFFVRFTVTDCFLGMGFVVLVLFRFVIYE
ncbi:hypothetical protein AKO1_003513 [Acrasis kona]|uniref:Uncharacterized protein n=1 Tax=Acrasis kona TaxID=1008807 RepID=A0AAW2Z4C4_9EUKA